MEAEIGYTQTNTSKKNQIAALVFTNVSGNTRNLMLRAESASSGRVTSRAP